MNMKKNILWKAFVAVLAMMMCVNLTACGDDDDDDDPVDENGVAKVEVGYQVGLGQGWYDYFDMTATYTAIDGSEVTKTFSSDFEYKEAAAVAQATDKESLKIVATPKSTLPAIDESAEYDFGVTIYTWIGTYDKNGSELDLGGVMNKIGPDKKTGKEVANYVTGEHKVCNLSASR
jgi:hypothetical protein